MFSFVELVVKLMNCYLSLAFTVQNKIIVDSGHLKILDFMVSVFSYICLYKLLTYD